jgi:hypothetical protein
MADFVRAYSRCSNIIYKLQLVIAEFALLARSKPAW